MEKHDETHNNSFEVREPIIIDCDPGHDDAIAILMAAAFNEKLEILGVTTVGGNQTLEKITKNALAVLSFLQLDVPLAKGAAGPLTRHLETGADAHGETGMDGPSLPESTKEPVNDHAVTFMAELLRKSSFPVTLVPIGPLTNIALLLSTYPELKAKINRISLMGGGLYRGNVTATAEFNIYVDPEAAKIVFQSGIPIIMSGLDVTEKALIMDEEIEELRQRGGKYSVFVAELLDFYSIASKRFGFAGSALHDPCAIAVLLKPELFKSSHVYVNVETQGEATRGMTYADLRPVPNMDANTEVLLDVDRKALINFLFEALARLDEQCI